jgi:glycerol-3-phosphate cytidylyltransferase
MPSRIGYTTGVFDMFHIGHLNLLRQARQNCDYLIVGVTTDELSLDRKGKRPIVPYRERVEIVQNIRYVDDVVPHEHMDRLETWNDLRYDIMFKGDDWRGAPEWVALENQLGELGVEVSFFPYTPHQTSSLLRRRVVQERGSVPDPRTASGERPRTAAPAPPG